MANAESLLFVPVKSMKGFLTSIGFVGFTDGGYRILFPTEQEYIEYMEEEEENGREEER